MSKIEKTKKKLKLKKESLVQLEPTDLRQVAGGWDTYPTWQPTANC
jgi:hypothetical protein